jgi:uncharacterized protein YajQ (UPF0234 family)
MKSSIPICLFFAFNLMVFRIMAQSEAPVTWDSLPVAVKEHLHKKFHDYSSSNTMKLIDTSGEVTYKLDMQLVKAIDGKSTVHINHLIYNSTGKLLSKLKEKEVYFTESSKPKPLNSNDGQSGHQH